MIIKVTGSIHRFLNKCIDNNISIKDIKYFDKYIIATIKEEDYKEVKRLNYYSKVTVLKYLGKSGILKFIKTYLFDLLMVILFCLLIFCISRVTVKVDITHESEKLRLKVNEILLEYNIKAYTISRDLKYLNKVSDEILKNNREVLEWISINKEGMRYKVSFEERIVPNTIKGYSMCNIIAKKDGTIKSIVATKGEEVVEKDMVVKKGDVLISGILYLNEKVKDIVCAKGEVKASVWYKVHVIVPFKYQEKKYTGATRTNLYFNGNYLYKKNYNLFDTSLIFKSNYFNTLFKIEKEREYIIIDKKRTYNEAKTLGINRAKEEVLKKLPENSSIFDQKVLKEIKNNSTIELDIFISTIESIGESVLIDESSIKESDENDSE